MEHQIAVYALSTDDEAHAQKVAGQIEPNFPMLYDLPAQETAASWGSFHEERRSILHATGFILDPEHKVASATYSTGPIGRLTAYEVIRFVRFNKAQRAK